MDRLDTVIAPVRFKLDDAIVTIYEVLSMRLISGETWYSVNVDITLGKYRTRRFNIHVRSMRELKAKLLVEISKIKLLRVLGVKI